MADKKSKDEGATATLPNPESVKIPCVGACRGEDREHEVSGKSGTCAECGHVRRLDVGLGSPKGPRWFVTKYPAWTTTVVPEDWIINEHGRTGKQKAVRAIFKKIVKPRKLVSLHGEIGSENPDGGDSNACRWMGVFFVNDPGEAFDKTIKSEALARMVIAHLRGHEYYRKTAQDNRLSANPELVELTWDPTLREKATAAVARRAISLDQSDHEAPAETAPAPTRAKVGLTRRLPLKENTAPLSEGE